MGSKSISTSNRSIKSSTQSGNIVGDSAVLDPMNQDGSPNSSSHPEGAENQPLLQENTVTQGKPSRRAIGVQPTPTSENDRAEIEEADSESHFQRNLYRVHRKYRLFIHNAKWVVNILIVINTVWLVTTLISDFFFDISLFHSNNRANSFNDITLIFISIIANAFNLWFNKLGLYSSLDYVLNMVLCLLTLFNLELIYMVAYTRRRVGFMGTFTYLWAAFSFFVGIVLDWYLLDYNKQITQPFDDDNFEASDDVQNGRIQHQSPSSGKHTLSEWIFIGIRNVVKSLLLVFFILFTCNTLLSSWDIHRVTGKVADVSVEAASYDAFHWVDDSHSYKLHIRCYGDIFESEDNIQDEKKQAILLYEHGGYDTAYLSATWIQELYHLNRVQRYCTYERPGYGLSDSAPAPTSIAMVADHLKHALLNEAKIMGPFVTVGYDLGGLFTQVFTAKNVDIVEGMMLVESWHEDLLLKNYLQRLLPPDRGGDGDGDGDSQPGRDPDDHSWVPPEIRRYNEFRIWWRGLWSTVGLKLQTSWLLAHHGSNERIYGRDMQYQGRFLRGKFLESVTSSMLSYKDVVNYKDKLKNVKVSVVSAKEMVKKSPQWGNWQRELSKISSKTQEWKLVDGGHEVYKFGLGKQQAQDVLLRLIGEKDRY